MQQLASVNQSVQLNENKIIQEKTPIGLTSLRTVVDTSTVETLGATLLRLIDIYPFAYPIASCSARVSGVNQSKIDDIETILLQLPDSERHGEPIAWLEVENKVAEIFDSFGTESPDAVALVEFTISRLALFLNLYYPHRDIADVKDLWLYLRRVHLEALEIHSCEPSVLAELVANWQIGNRNLKFLDDTLDVYESLLGQTGLLHYRNIVENQFRTELEETDEESPCLYRLVTKVAHKVPLSQNIIDHFVSELNDSDDYFNALSFLEDCKLNEMGAKLAEDWRQKYPEQNETVSFYFMQRKKEAGDLPGAAEEIFTAFCVKPSLDLFDELKQFCNENNLEWSEWKRRVKESLVERVSATGWSFELNSLLVDICVLDDEFEEAIQYAEQGCNSPSFKFLAEKCPGIPFHKLKQMSVKSIDALLQEKNENTLERVGEFLNILYKRASNKTENGEFKEYARSLKADHNLKGTSARIFKRLGV